ncbi:MAG: hypothetical protein KY468_02650 [Armatimonadetes bacterium]|nr:hypothetical protein [Armatimonadota bacterium]
MAPPADLELLLQRLHALAGGRPLYLVGGSVRDLLLGRPVKDVDVVLPGPVEAFGRQASRALGGSFFYLRQAEETARIVLPVPAGQEDSPSVRQVDLVALHGGSLEDDLRRRDFTVNAMALDLSHGVPPLSMEGVRGALADPLNGREDLQAGCIRRCTPRSLVDDPLRALRAVRFAAGFDGRIEAETRQQVIATGPQLVRVSAERIRDELFLMLDLSPPTRAMEAVNLLQQMGLLPHALRGPVGEGGVERFVRLTESVLPESALPERDGGARSGPAYEAAGAYLRESLTPPRTREALLKLAALIGPEVAGERAEGDDRRENARHRDALRSRLEMSAAEAQYLRKAWGAARVLLPLPHDRFPDPITIHRIFRRYGDAVPGAVFLAGSEAPHLPGSTAERAWLQAWFHERDRYLPDPLLNGNDLMREFRQRGGPWVAEWLKALQEAQVDGEVKNDAEAWDFVRRRKQEEEKTGID